MITFPNAKINLGLNILAKRSDGFHDISSVFYPVPWSDILEIIPAVNLSFQSSGLAIPDDKKGNLCLRAYQLLQKEHDLPPVSIHLHKIIPIGAGLGGGSADGAFTLKMLNEIFQIGLSTRQLQSYASELGSDCPFFIENTPVLAEGRGELFSDLSNLNLAGNWLLMVYPNLHISTQEAYAGIEPRKPAILCQDALEGSYDLWRKYLKNDFETSLFPKQPLLAKIKVDMYAKGAVYASMTGSGSTIFGIFEQETNLSDWEKFTSFQTQL